MKIKKLYLTENSKPLSALQKLLNQRRNDQFHKNKQEDPTLSCWCRACVSQTDICLISDVFIDKDGHFIGIPVEDYLPLILLDTLTIHQVSAIIPEDVETDTPDEEMEPEAESDDYSSYRKVYDAYIYPFSDEGGSNE